MLIYKGWCDDGCICDDVFDDVLGMSKASIMIDSSR